MSKQQCILVVDDEPLNVDLLEQQLEELGFKTVSARDGREALEQVARQAPDLILLDVMMPNLDGFSVCRILKENPETQLIPIVIMTALDAVDDRIKGIEAGADDFLTKPVDDRELLARMRTSLKLRQTVDTRIGHHQKINEHLFKFVPEVVRRQVIANPHAPELEKRDRDVTVLFLDVCGYTRLSEELTPDALNQLVERYFSAYLDAIHELGGDISESTGDGLMVIFQDPTPQRHAAMAADTGLALHATTLRLNSVSDDPPLQLHMGINSGIASVGSTRYEGQSNSRWVFTADGLVANLASRLADLAEGGEILVGPETAERLQASHLLEEYGSRSLKNISHPIAIHRLLKSPG